MAVPGRGDPEAVHGTTALLIIAGVIVGMPLGVQIIKSGLMQLGGELEEAARVVVVACIIMLISLGGALLARLLGLRGTVG